jgi:hypothetical protein
VKPHNLNSQPENHMAALDFNPNSVAPSERSYTVLPAGWYSVTIDGASVENNKNNPGRHVKLDLTVISVNGRGRKLFPKVNFENPSATSQRIGQEQLRDICAACGIERLTDTDQLLRKQLDIKVKIEPASKGYAESNDVQAYVPYGTKAQAGAPAAHQAGPAPAPWQQSAAPTQAPVAAPAQASTPPWVKR